MDTDYTLELCPFCGSKDVELCSGGDCHYAQCQSCMAEGSYPETEEEAVLAWNTRNGFAIARYSKRLVEQLRKENEELKFILEGLQK